MPGEHEHGIPCEYEHVKDTSLPSLVYMPDRVLPANCCSSSLLLLLLSSSLSTP